MTYRIVSFPVQLSRDIDGLILGARMAVADVMRCEARKALDSAVSAGVDLYSAGQRLTFLWANSARASKLLRNVPPSLAQWAFRSVGIRRDQPDAGYVEAGDGAVGIFGPRWLQAMPGGMMMVKAGGVNAVGSLPEGTTINLREVFEVRIQATPSDGGTVTGHVCEIVLSDYRGGGADETDPVDSDMEREDA
jgi:hypothetical protein